MHSIVRRLPADHDRVPQDRHRRTRHLVNITIHKHFQTPPADSGTQDANYSANEETMNCLHLIPLIIPVLLFGTPENAAALQTHAAPEGIYVHQMAHVLFMTALIYLYWHTRRTQETTSRGWKYFQVFCIFLILWNILAFTGHETYEHLHDKDFVLRNTRDSMLAHPLTFKKFLYYITKMDHFLVIPALIALVISLRTFYLEAMREVKK